LTALVDVVARRFQAGGEKTFVRDDTTGEPLTYAEVDALSTDGAQVLRAFVGPGSPVVIYAGAVLAKVIAWFACIKAEAVDVPIDPDIKGSMLAEMLAKIAPAVILTDGEGLLSLQRSGGALVEEIPVIQILLSDYQFSIVSAPRATVPSPQWGEGFEGLRSIRFTSGSTGLPKGVMFSEKLLLGKAEQFVGLMGYESSDVLYSAFPLHHSLASINGVLPTMLVGGSLVIRSRFSVSQFWERVRIHQATLAHLIDPPMKMLLSRDPSHHDRDHSVRKVWTGQGSSRAFEQRFGVQVVRIYNMSELNVVSVLEDRCHLDDSTCYGTISSRYLVEVRDEEGALIPTGETGEIFVRPLGADDMFLGYFGDWAYTLDRWRDLWFRTGDVGYVSAQRCLHLSGRVAGRLRRRGVNLSAEAIERVAEDLPTVVECVAVPVSAAIGEDDVKILVTVSDPAGFDPAALMDHLAANLPKSHLPRFVALVETIPKTAMGKVNRATATGMTAVAEWDFERSGN